MRGLRLLLNVDNATISQEIMTIEGALTDVRAIPRRAWNRGKFDRYL